MATFRCKQCNAEYGGTGSEGLCPACLLSSALVQSVVTAECPECRQVMEIADEETEQGICPFCATPFSPVTGATASEVLNRPLTRLGHFELLKVLGSGAFGTVWQAHDMVLNRVVAIKLPRKERFANLEEEERFLREARISAQLRHPGIVPVHGVESVDGQVFIVSEFVDGITLAQWKMDQQPTFRQAAEWVAQAGEALDYSHRFGIIHRDLKPGNIMIEPCREKDGGYRLRVMDFGMAKREKGGTALTLRGHILGTSYYMSPEQIKASHTVDRRADVYSLGVILYELLTGEVPFHGTTQEVLHQVLETEIRPLRYLNRRIPADLETIALKCLERNPEQRYPTAGELTEDLRHWLNDEPITARPISLMGKIWRWSVRKPALAAMTVALILALVGGFIGVFWQWRIAVAIARDANRQRDETLNAYRRARREESAAATFKQEKEAALGTLLREKEKLTAERDQALKQTQEAAQEIQRVRERADSLGKEVQKYEELARKNEKRAEAAEQKTTRSDESVSKQLVSADAAGPALYGQALQLVNLPNFEEALQKIALAIKVYPSDASYHCLKGNILESLLRIPEALEAYRQALQINPQHPAAVENLALCEEILRLVDGSNSPPPEMFLKLRALMIKQGRLSEASAILLRVTGDAVVRARIMNAVLDQSPYAGLLAGNKRRIVSNQGRLELDLGGLAIKEVLFLSGIPLNRLILSRTAVSDLAPLKGMPLADLDLGHTSIDDLPLLRSLPLSSLSLEATPVRDITRLQGMRLQALNLSRTAVDSVLSLKGLPLALLDLSNTRVKDLSPLEGMKLNHLCLSRTPVEDLRPLRGMPLATLYLDGCAGVKDLSIVLTLPQLRSLAIPSHFKDLEFLQRLSSLEYLDYSTAKMKTAREFLERLKGAPQRSAR